MNEQQSPSARHGLTAPQERALLHKQLLGVFPPGCRWTTMLALIRTGMLREDSQHAFVVTAQGNAYCAAHLMDLRPLLRSLPGDTLCDLTRRSAQR